MKHDNDYLISNFLGCPSAEIKYPIVQWDTKKRRSKDKWLLLQDIYVRAKHNYDISMWNEYKGIITWNSKIYEKHSNDFNMILFKEFPYIKKFIYTDKFNSFNERDGVCLISKYCKPYYKDDAITERYNICEYLDKNNIKIDCYGIDNYNNYCSKLWKGASACKLETLNNYKFYVCFENCYDEYWSNNYVTEKIYDCFASKIIPIYYGAYNIEDIIPNDLYIDYRDYKNNKEGLLEKIKNITENEYVDITEKAFEYYNNKNLYWYEEELEKLNV